MVCFVDEQIALHNEADSNREVKVEDALNEYAVIDLFNDSKGEFSNGFIELKDVIKRAILDDSSFITELLAESVNDNHSEKVQKALRKLSKNRFIVTALEMNKDATKQLV